LLAENVKSFVILGEGVRVGLSKKTIRGFFAGEEAASLQVYQAYRRLLYFVILSFVPSKEDADEVYQEVFIKLFQSRHVPESEEALRPYLCKIAKNAALDFLRGEKAGGDSASFNEDSDGGVEDQKSLFWDYLRPTLNEKEALVVVYKAAFSLSWEEIVSLTGIPNSTVRLLYRNSMKKLRKEFAHDSSERSAK